MAPSRGLLLHGRAIVQALSRRNVRLYSALPDLVPDARNRFQSYVSRSQDPYLNLSIENYILQKSPPTSTVLFLYTNRPCVVIGRNQNPWLEVNLGMLDAVDSKKAKDTKPPGIGKVDLVRRRSGGGAVFHDEGNMNWSVICPPAEFTRDKHGEMVVRALRKLGIDRVRVNERHDIVLDASRQGQGLDARSPARPLKVSGSAYKLTRTRALHHGTCLLSSPNLHIIPQYLRSPAKPYIKARGVESVSSPVANLGLEVPAFEKAVQDEFSSTYNVSGVFRRPVMVGEDELELDDIRKGYDELRSPNWTYCQTPQFQFSSHPAEIEKDHDLWMQSGIPGADIGITFTVRNGVISDIFATCAQDAQRGGRITTFLRDCLQDQKLHEIRGWLNILASADGTAGREIAATAAWLEEMLPSVSDLR